MPADKIGSKLNLLNGDCEIIPKEKRNLQHKYLNIAERYGQAQFNNNTNYYMPYINAFSNHGTITEIQIETCPSKLLFGHNLQELDYKDFDTMLDILVADLEYAGIYTNKEILRQKPLNKLDVNKLVV